MYYLLAELIAVLLFVGFFGLTVVETRNGTRVFGASRRRLDRWVARAMFIVNNVDWGSFFGHMVQSAIVRVAHDIAHFVLQTIRFSERRLTALVRSLRDRRPNLLAPKASRTSPVNQVSAYVQNMVHRNRQERKETTRRKARIVKVSKEHEEGNE